MQRSPSPVDKQDSKHAEHPVSDLISFDNLEEVKTSTLPKKINHAVQTELRNFNITAPVSKPSCTCNSNKATQTLNTSSTKINKAIQTIQIQERHHNNHLNRFPNQNLHHKQKINQHLNQHQFK